MRERTSSVLRYSPARGYEFAFQCRLAGRQRESGANSASSGYVTATTHLCQTGQIYKGEVEDVRAVYAEGDGKLANALILTGNAKRLSLDLLADVVKVGEAFVHVEELAPLGEVGWMFGDGGVDELQNKRPTGDNAGAAREEVTADDAGYGVGG